MFKGHFTKQNQNYKKVKITTIAKNSFEIYLNIKIKYLECLFKTIEGGCVL